MSDFDPLSILGALERHRVAYVLIGDLAGVLHGTDLTADTVEITPSLKPENIERLDRVFGDLGVTPKLREVLQEVTPESPSTTIPTSRGVIALTAVPSGTAGYDDLRRAARREPLGRGIRAPVASAPDIIRAVSGAGRHELLEHRLRRLIDLERSLSPEM